MTKKRTIRITGKKGKKYVQFPFFITKEDRKDIIRQRLHYLIKLKKTVTQSDPSKEDQRVTE